MSNVIERVVAALVPLYTIHPERMKTFWRRDAYYLQPDDADYRLIIGRSGRNLEALRLVADFAVRPGNARIEVIEPERSSQPLPPLAMVENKDHPASESKLLADQLLAVLDLICGSDVPPVATTSSAEPCTTVISASSPIEIDPITRRSLSILFGAIGRIRGRNVRIHLNHHE